MTAQPPGSRPAALDRALQRTRAHVARARRAVVSAGPGRLAGVVTDVRVDADRITVRGWAALPSQGIAAVWLTVDGVPLALADRGRTTPTDAGGRPLTGRSPHAGWVASIERSRLQPGYHRVGALALLGYGLVEQLVPLDVDLPSADPPGALDLPAEGEQVSGMLAVRGWFLTSRGYDRVEVTTDDGPPRPAQLLHHPRPDIAAVVDDADAPLSGWEVLVPLGQTAREVRVVAEAVGPHGRILLGKRTVRSVPVDVTVHDPGRAAVLAARTDLLARGHRPDEQGLNLLVLTHHLGLGGGQLYLQELLRRLLEREGVTCTVMSLSDGVLREDLEAMGARVHVVANPGWTGVGYEEWLQLVTGIAVTTGANRVLANTAGCYWGVDLAARLGVPSVWAVHESYPPEVYLAVGFPGPPDEWVRRRFLDAFEQAGAVVFEADATQRLFEHLVRPGRAVRVDYGIDLERVAEVVAGHPRDAVRRRLGIGPDEVLLMCLGTLEPRKAQALLATAFAQVSRTHAEAVLALVGDRGDVFSAIVHQLVDRLGVGDRLRLLPVTPDIEDWYLAADAFILVSSVESLPRSMLEAMAFGTPVIASAVFGVPEVIRDGVNGLLVDNSSVPSVAAVLRRLLQMRPDERQRIATAGRLTVEANRSSTLYAHDYRTLFDVAGSADPVDLDQALGRG
ncbi:glycosyltransferase family 4 protein [Cellulomonas aerilata]|uniref:Uncharacterized protein n=1 Tax=Cellulomonas aerilata TaxID=515326 RepID=A0A512DH43_9CELL|nr:glycosyltransferase family 4 protein [Cellulomonas aerilata]GEO35804.1 hypothetical protein CAE01nite_35290 [Cellulomonas aerilata]